MTESEFTFPIEEPAPQQGRGRRTMWILIAIGGAIALVILLGVVALLVARGGVGGKVFYIPSEAMVPTLMVDDRVHTSAIGDKSEIKRGWVVVFTAPEQTDPKVETIIKRVVGLPGETIEAKNGLVYINDKPLSEPYVKPGNVTDTLPRTVLPPGRYFMLGDNRENSADSRFFGPIERSTIEWHAEKVIYPLDRRDVDLP